jgi:hypothetical protein
MALPLVSDTSVAPPTSSSRLDATDSLHLRLSDSEPSLDESLEPVVGPIISGNRTPARRKRASSSETPVPIKLVTIRKQTTIPENPQPEKQESRPALRIKLDIPPAPKKPKLKLLQKIDNIVDAAIIAESERTADKNLQTAEKRLQLLAKPLCRDMPKHPLSHAHDQK